MGIQSMRSDQIKSGTARGRVRAQERGETRMGRWRNGEGKRKSAEREQLRDAPLLREGGHAV
jgi:hypothetical protein